MLVQYDGFFFKNQDVVVVGGGDSAAEEATHLSAYVIKSTCWLEKMKCELLKSCKRVF